LKGAGAKNRRALKGTVARIRVHEYFIILLGPNTLKSRVILHEIVWTMPFKLSIIPIWHNGFHYTPGTVQNMPQPIEHLLTSTHTIHIMRVMEENSLAYNAAMTQLLNFFSITS